MNIGQKVKVMDGASKWMKDRSYWLDDMPDSIDGMIGKIVEDYTGLAGDDSHFGVHLDYESMQSVSDDDIAIGINPHWLQVID